MREERASDDEPRRVLPTDWQRVDMPEGWKTFPCDLRVDFEKFEQLKLGIFPRRMEEKWFIYWQEPWLHLHRSWTGYEVYALRFAMEFEGVRIVEVRMNADREQFSPDEDADHVGDALWTLAVLYGGAHEPSASGEQAIADWAKFGNASFGGGARLGVRPSEVAPPPRERDSG